LVLVFVLYTAWMNGVFLRCPHCGKIGSWRYDAAEPCVEKRGKTGVSSGKPVLLRSPPRRRESASSHVFDEFELQSERRGHGLQVGKLDVLA